MWGKVGLIKRETPRKKKKRKKPVHCRREIIFISGWVKKAGQRKEQREINEKRAKSEACQEKGAFRGSPYPCKHSHNKRGRHILRGPPLKMEFRECSAGSFFIR